MFLLHLILLTSQKLSEGAFGEAWLAQWHRSAVVVKTLKRKPEAWTAENFIEFANEAAASERVSKHPNIGDSFLLCVTVTHCFAELVGSSICWRVQANADVRDGLPIHDARQPRGFADQEQQTGKARLVVLLAFTADEHGSLQTIVTFAIEAATGLAHLHANQPEPVPTRCLIVLVDLHVHDSCCIATSRCAICCWTARVWCACRISAWR